MKFILLKINRTNFFSLIISLSILLLGGHVSGQGSWSFAAPTDGSGNSGPETGRGICTDATGNIYVVGVFSGTSDFDLSAATTSTAIANGNDGYIASYTKTGVFRWKVIVGGAGNDFGSPSGAICTNGTYVWFTGTVNMGGGSIQVINSGLSTNNTVTGNSANGSDAIVGKLNCSDGGFQWATLLGGTGGDNGQGICVDPSGCCYSIGAYSSSFVLNNVTAPVTTGGAGTDLYVAKLSPSGTLLHFAGGGATGVGDMGVSGAGICYVPGSPATIVAVGSFGAATATYGTFTNIINSGFNDAVLVELDTVLTFTNALGMGTSGTDELLGAVYDPFSAAVYVCGEFTGNSFTLPGTPALSSVGLGDAVIARYSVSANNFIWSRKAGGVANDQAWSVTSDGGGGILVTGFTASAPATFGSLTMNTAGVDDIFVARYNAVGTAIWLQSAGGTGGDDGRSICSYVETSPAFTQFIYITGNFQNTVAFNTTTLTGDGGNDFFVARLNDLTAPFTATTSQVNLTCNAVCNGSATVVPSGGATPYTYSWSPSGGNSATASSLCAGNYTVTITDANNIPITRTFTITQPAALGGAISGTTTICSGQSATLTLTVTGTGTISGLLSNGTSYSGTAPTINVNVSPASSTTYTIASMSNGSCTAQAANLTGSAIITVNTNTWLGATNNWNTASNWCGGLPTSGSDVIIPSSGSVPFMPHILNGNTANVRSITLNTGTLTVDAGGTLNVTGNITLNPTGAFNAAGGTVNFTGVVAQTIQAGFAAGSIAVSGSAKTLSGDVTVSNSLSFSGGMLDVGTHTLAITGNGTLTGYGAGSYIRTAGLNGGLRRQVPGTGVSVVFPVGSTSYNPATLSNSGGVTDDYTVSVRNQVLQQGTSGAQVDANNTYAINRTWDIGETTVGGSNVSMTLQWNGGEENTANFQYNHVYIAHYIGGTWDIPLANVNLAPAASGSNPYTTTRSGITTFSPFVVGSAGGAHPLPVVLGSLSAVNEGTANRIYWNSINEQQLDHYELERSEDGRIFTRIDIIEAKGSVRDYIAYDRSPAAGFTYYRLKMTGGSGAFIYSAIVKAWRNTANGELSLQVSPNPASANILIEAFGGTDGARILLTDLSGQRVIKSVIKDQKVVLNLEGLLPGIYFINYKDETRAQTVKILKQ